MQVKRVHIFVIVLLMALASTATLCEAQTLSKPKVTLPGQWTLDSETVYPNGPSEHDPAGGGSVRYLNPVNNDAVTIYYEKAPSTSYTNATLEAEASSLFQRDFASFPNLDIGTMKAAGVQAGYAEAYDSANVAYVTYLVLVKGGYYMNVIAYYDATNQSETQVMSIINSISIGVAGLDLGGSTLYIIVGVVVAIVIVAVAVVVLRRGKKVTQQAPQSAQDYPPPPPP